MPPVPDDKVRASKPRTDNLGNCWHPSINCGTWLATTGRAAHPIPVKVILCNIVWHLRQIKIGRLKAAIGIVFPWFVKPVSRRIGYVFHFVGLLANLPARCMRDTYHAIAKQSWCMEPVLPQPSPVDSDDLMPDVDAGITALS